MQVEESTPFAPIARKEIGALAWHVVNELPMTKEQSAMVCVIVSCLPTARYSNSFDDMIVYGRSALAEGCHLSGKRQSPMLKLGFHQLTLTCVPLFLSRQAVVRLECKVSDSAT